jgi:hypothetical protein
VSVEDDKRSAWPRTNKTWEYVEEIRELIHEDRRRTIRALADTIRINYGVSQEILRENLNMRRIAATFFSPILDKWSKAVARKLVSWATREC